MGKVIRTSLNQKKMTKSMKIGKLIWVVFLGAILFLSACTKESNVGDDIVQMPGDNLNVVYCDTFTIYGHSFFDDSVRSDEATLSLLGSFKDNIFGTTTTGFYTQIRMASNNLDYGVNPICDSIVLALRYSSLFGDTTAIHKISVYELSESIYKDSIYYMSTPALDVESSKLAEITTGFNQKDSLTISGIRVAPQLRLKLDNSFGIKILSKSGQTELTTNDEFVKYIKGLYVTAEKKSSGGGYAAFDLISAVSQVTMYYHNQGDTTKKTSNFVINSYCARINVADHYGYADADPALINQINNKDSISGNNVLYVQNLGGIGTRFSIPYLTNLVKDKQIAVQRAELLISPVAGSISTLKPHPYLGFIKLNNEGTEQFIYDFISETNNFDGHYDESKGLYSFVITRQLKRYLDGTDGNFGFKLFGDYGLGQSTLSSSYYPYRLVFNGPKSAVAPMKLKVMYTIVN